MFRIFAVNCIVPLFVILVIGAVAGYFSLKEKKSIKGEMVEYFVKAWKAGRSDPESGVNARLSDRFSEIIIRAYEYEKYKESVNQRKYYFYKLLVMLIILCIPFLVLVLISGKEWILHDSEWNNIYLYTVILVPLIFGYLVNKYIKIKQYHEAWYRHMRNRHNMEWRMIEFVKDCEMLEAGMTQQDANVSTETIKRDFINDMCTYWKSVTTEIPSGSAAKEENILEDFIGLIHKD